MSFKKVLITGINGFIGSHCKSFLLGKNYKVFGIDINGKPSQNVIIGEVTYSNLLQFNETFDYIVHLAGSSTVSAANQNPEHEKIKSVGSTGQVLDFMRLCNPHARLILSSSAAVYGNRYNKPVLESYELNPISIYGLHKLESEKLCSFYAKNYGLDIKVLRFFSVYGNGLKKQLMWDSLNRIKELRGKQLLCFGKGTEIRDFIHVNDAVRFIEMIFNLKSKDYSVYNCASGKAFTVKEIIEMLVKEYYNSCEISLVFDNIQREGNPEVLLADISNIEKLGFSSNIDLRNGIKDYVKWFKTQN